jgi:hypothetical protein
MHPSKSKSNEDANSLLRCSSHTQSAADDQNGLSGEAHHFFRYAP